VSRVEAKVANRLSLGSGLPAAVVTWVTTTEERGFGLREGICRGL